MTAAAILERLRVHGVRLRLDGDRVHLSADRPPPPELVDEARAVKGDLIEYLRRERVARCGTLADACPLLVRCACGAATWRPLGSTRCLRCEDDHRESARRAALPPLGRHARGGR